VGALEGEVWRGGELAWSVMGREMRRNCQSRCQSDRLACGYLRLRASEPGCRHTLQYYLCHGYVGGHTATLSVRINYDNICGPINPLSYYAVNRALEPCLTLKVHGL